MFSQIFLLIYSCLLQTAWSWDGPPTPLGAMLANIAAPASYVDLSALGYWTGTTPFQASLRGNSVLSQTSSDLWQLGTSFSNTSFQSAIALGGSGVNVPTNLWGADINASFQHKIADLKNNWGLLGSFGSDSDIPFNSIYELDFQITGFYQYPVDDLHSWFFFLNYSISRPFLPGVPLPGAGYLIVNPTEHYVLALGVPFFFKWDFIPQWTWSTSYFIPYSINSTVEYRFAPATKAFFSFQWTTQSWFRAFRSDNLNRIIFDEKKLLTGVSKVFADSFFVSGSFGFAFDQQLYEAHQQTLSPQSQFLPVNLLAQIEIAHRF